MASDDMRIVLATLLYFAVVFGTGLVLGPVRLLWLEPRVGPAIAELIEAPFLVIAGRRCSLGPQDCSHDGELAVLGVHRRRRARSAAYGGFYRWLQSARFGTAGAIGTLCYCARSYLRYPTSAVRLDARST